MTTVRVAAVDLGASSGRVHAATVGADRLELEEVSRFPNGGVSVDGRLHWDILRLYAGVLAGLASAGRSGPLDSVGIDSWAVDYGLLRPDGLLLTNPRHYRDPRTDEPWARTIAGEGARELYRRSGIALQRFNTVYQLLDDADRGLLALAGRALLVPDLVSWWLTGVAGTEVTNASTTQLLDVDGAWDGELLRRLGLPGDLFAPLRHPGQAAGMVHADVLAELGLSGSLPVTAVGSHDTASAVVAVPAETAGFAYLSCGTWSLVGVELGAPVVTEDARTAGFTNERGVDGTFRLLRNVMGLWLHQQSVLTWERAGRTVDLVALHAAAAAVEPLRSVVDPDDPAFLPPGDMPSRLAAACRATGQPEPGTPAEVTRCILESLALAYRRCLDAVRRLGGCDPAVVHLVGGGVHNRLLCQMTADACGLPVVAGPVEAAAIGNALVQARALGAAGPTLADLRALVAATSRLDRYEPNAAAAARFDGAADRLDWGGPAV